MFSIPSITNVLILLVVLVIGSYHAPMKVICDEYKIELSNAGLNFSISKENRTHKIQNIISNHIDCDQGNQPKNDLSVNSKESNLKLSCYNDTDCLPWTYCNNNSNLCECADMHDMALCDHVTLNISVLAIVQLLIDFQNGDIFKVDVTDECFLRTA